MHANYMIGATLLNFIPPPKRSLTSYMPFNPQQGEGYKESRLKRALLALPIWVMFYLASIVMDLTASMSFAVDRLKSGRVAWGNESVPLRESFYHIEWLDELLVNLGVLDFAHITDTRPPPQMASCSHMLYIFNLRL